MNVISNYIQQQGFLVLDGAMATELESRGADLNDPLWSARCLIEAPHLISQVHQDYLQAGADVLISATYQASAKGFQSRGLNPQEARTALQRGIELACSARDEFWSQDENRTGRMKPLVAASMGPFGACLHDGSEYHGHYAESWLEVETFHRSRLEVMADAGADVLAFETIPSLAEAQIMLNLLTDFPDQFAWLSFSCRDRVHVCHGETFHDCVSLASQHRQLAAAGVNCTPPRYVTSLLNSARAQTFPLLVYPNSGETWVARDSHWVGQSGDQIETEVWFRAGAQLIGGCCRTKPSDIKRIRRALLALTKECVGRTA